MFEPPPEGVDDSGRRGQSEVVGVALLLSLIVTGSVVVVSVGTPALGDARTASHDRQATYAMGELASEGAAVALGGGSTRRVSFPDGGEGTYEVQDDTGWLRVTRINETGYAEPLYNETLGAVVYRSGDDAETVVAYQGGGVWKRQGNGSVMVSPPQFHYRDATLTLPLVTVRGSGSVAGGAEAELTAGDTKRVFPNASATYASGEPYQNPLDSGRVEVTVHSRYYEAWADYFETRTEGAVRVNHSRQQATLNLTALGAFGHVEMPPEGQAIEVRGLPQHDDPVDNFTVTLVPDDTDMARFNNLQWSLYASEGSEEFELHLKKGVNADDPTTDCTEQKVRLTVYYRPQAGEPYHGWKSDDAFRTQCYDADDDGTADETRLVANLTGPSQLAMTDLANDDLEYLSPTGSRASSVTLDGHAYADGGDDDAAVGTLVDAYLGRMAPNVDLVVDDKNSDTVNEAESYGYLQFDQHGTITFLHITEHRCRVVVR